MRGVVLCGHLMYHCGFHVLIVLNRSPESQNLVIAPQGRTFSEFVMGTVGESIANGSVSEVVFAIDQIQSTVCTTGHFFATHAHVGSPTMGQCMS